MCSACPDQQTNTSARNLNPCQMYNSKALPCLSLPCFSAINHTQWHERIGQHRPRYTAEEMVRSELASFPLPRFCLAWLDCNPLLVHLSHPQCRRPTSLPSQSTEQSPGLWDQCTAKHQAWNKNLNFTAWRKLNQVKLLHSTAFICPNSQQK